MNGGCPECEADVEIDEYDVDKGEIISRPECGWNRGGGAVPLELDVARQLGGRLEGVRRARSERRAAVDRLPVGDGSVPVAFSAGWRARYLAARGHRGRAGARCGRDCALGVWGWLTTKRANGRARGARQTPSRTSASAWARTSTPVYARYGV